VQHRDPLRQLHHHQHVVLDDEDGEALGDPRTRLMVSWSRPALMPAVGSVQTEELGSVASAMHFQIALLAWGVGGQLLFLP